MSDEEHPEPERHWRNRRRMGAWLRGLAAALDRLCNRQKLFRRAALVWACCLITWTVYEVFTNAPNISGGTATALASVCGLLTVVVGLYQWSRDHEDRDR